MKTYLKVILTILLIIATIMSIVSALVSGASIIINLLGIVASLKYSTWLYTILGVFSFFASTGLCLAFLTFFLVIAIACIVGIVYVFVSGSDKRIKDLEAVINNATTNQESTYNSND